MKSICAIFVAFVVSLSAVAQAVQLDQPSRTQAAADQVLDPQIAEILESSDWQKQATSRGLKIRGASVQVVVDTSHPTECATWISAHGGAHVLVSGLRVQAWVPDRHLRDLSVLDGVVWVGRPDYAVIPRPVASERESKEGTVTSEGVAAMAAPSWHETGINGEGVKVGVIDLQFETYEDLLGSDLPPADRVFFQSFGGSSTEGDHGTACAEIVYDVAPGGTLYLAQVATSFDVQEALEWFVENGVRVVTMSLSFFNYSPGDGTGPMHDKINQAVEQGDLVFATSAGNARQGHWQGETIDSDGDGWVEFEPGEEVNVYQRTFAVDDEITTFVSWDDWEVSDQDYSVHLFKVAEDGTTEEVEMADLPQTGLINQRPRERLSFTVVEPGRYGIGIFRKQVVGNNDLEIFDNDWDVGIVVEEGSLIAPADSSDVIAVAALSTSRHSIRDFSSAGPSNGPGGSFDGGLIKPDIGGYDGVSGVSLGRWYGTSAACPHVAGAAAVVMQANPSWSHSEVRDFLEGRAIDKGPVGLDSDYGWGRLSLGLVPGLDCSYVLTPDAANVEAESFGGSIHVATDEQCFWSATSQAEWLRVAPDARTGSGMVLFSPDDNLSSETREGILRVAGHDFIVTQKGGEVTYRRPSQRVRP